MLDEGTIVLIPAYQPDEKLVEIVEALAALDFPLVVVNDGSGPPYDWIFTQVAQWATILAHSYNRGKGRALKMGFDHIHRHFPGCLGAVTADADGQHCVEDIIRVAKALQQEPQALVLGVRSLGASTPWSSWLGNEVSRRCINALWDLALEDSQTGLRGLPRETLAPLINVAGERYEFETLMLFWAARDKRTIEQVPIRTIYFPGNPSSHFSLWRDSWRFFGAMMKTIVG